MSNSERKKEPKPKLTPQQVARLKAESYLSRLNRPTRETREAIEEAKRGKLPKPPEFQAKTHDRFRPLLHTLRVLADAKDVVGLSIIPIQNYSSSPRALARFRALAVVALTAPRPRPRLKLVKDGATRPHQI